MAAEREPSGGRRRNGSTTPARPVLQGIPGYLADDGPPDLDRLVHERVRLGMLSALAVNSTLSFTELKELLKTSDGNLSVHARKLEEANYISCTKGFEGRVPRTEYTITREGRKVLKDYLSHMERIIGAVRGGK